MGKQIVVPFGPQHPVLPEPIHLDLVLEDERVVEAIPSIGYVHRGLESLVKKREYKDYVFVAERICGICSYIHAAGYCQGIEAVMDIDVPLRAQYLRIFWSELSRLHSHLLWLGCYSDSFGFENLFMNAWRIRESILDIMEETSGGRVIQGTCTVGGVRKDVSNTRLREIVRSLDGIESQITELNEVFLRDPTVMHRTKGVGMLTKDQAWSLGAVGPVLRGSGVAMDIRTTGYGAYEFLKMSPVVYHGGDCYSRCRVRADELHASIDLIRQVVDLIPDGEIVAKVTGGPDGEYFSRIEQPRGEAVHYVKGDGSKHLVRHRVRTPTCANIAPLLTMLAGCELADVPVIVLSIDPCISCTER
jgi:Ni,Fe-hydrogenase III large subunit